MSELPDYVLDLVNEVATGEGFSTYTTELKAGSNHGDNFLGVLTSVTVKGQRNNNDDQLHLLVKLAPSNETRRQEFHSVAVFKREVLMYNKILPLFREFEREKGLADCDAFTAYPKCYVAIADEQRDQYVVIMEDLRPKGFAMWPKHLAAPADHSFRVVEQLARLHAISFALKDQRPKQYDELRELKDIIVEFFTSPAMVRVMQMGYTRAIDALENEEHKKIMTEVRDNVQEFFDEIHKEGACEPFGVINHGDCHNNNILYKYDPETKKVVDVCLVDYQISRFCSPALDLHYNLFGATVKSLRDREYKNILRHYHISLQEHIRKLGSDPDKYFTYNDLENQLKKFGKFAFIWGPMFVQMMIADPKDIPDLDQLSEDLANKDSDVQSFVKTFDADRQQEYDSRMRDLLTDLVDYGYYWK